jgi:ferredoxin, 2Fe-2S
MSKVIYIDKDEQQYVVEVESGANLMQAAIDNLVPGILGDCGGAAACATCHVFVDPEWADKTGKASEIEADLLDGLLETKSTSRLACQIIMSDALDGVVLHLPEQQL